MPEGLCILTPIWPAYQKFAPLLLKALGEFWPGHPLHYFIAPDAWDLPGISLDPGDDPYSGKNWSWSLLQGVRKARAQGYRSCYLIAEEHLPLACCHKEHLEETIPEQAQKLGASYVSLMGWDNKRYSFKSPRLGKKEFYWMHLTGSRDPRFHLHPAWWNLETLEKCCLLALQESQANGSAWHFEKVCDLAGDRLPSDSCYQICATAMSSTPGRSLASSLMIRWFYNRLMAIVPLLPIYWRRFYYDTCGFDLVYCDGPYPMVFSGALAKGKINPAITKFKDRIPSGIVSEIEKLASP